MIANVGLSCFFHFLIYIAAFEVQDAVRIVIDVLLFNFPFHPRVKLDHASDCPAYHKIILPD